MDYQKYTQASSGNRYLTFDGEWGQARLSEDEIEFTDDLMEQRTQCGDWRLQLARPSSGKYFKLAQKLWEYVVTIEALPVDNEDAVVILETVLVADFPSLLQLTALLKSGGFICIANDHPPTR